MNNKVFALIIIFILGLLIAFIISGGNKNSSSDGQIVSQHVYGLSEGTAKVIVEEAYSFSCPACAQSHAAVFKELREEYKDRVAFRVRHFPLSSNFPNAQAAHRAAEAASRQGENKFWEMYDVLFEERQRWVKVSSPDVDPVEQMKLFAEELGLDTEQFEQDFRSSEVNDIINNDQQEMRDKGAEATPTYFLNGEKRDTAQSFGNLEIARATLDAALAEFEEGTEETEETETNNGTDEDTEATNSPAAPEE